MGVNGRQTLIGIDYFWRQGELGFAEWPSHRWNAGARRDMLTGAGYRINLILMGAPVMDVEAHFWKLCYEATQFDDASYRNLAGDGTSEAVLLDAQASEQAMVKLIELVEKYPEQRTTFVHCFAELILWKRRAPFL